MPSPVADFTGRDDEIATLTAALAPNGRASVSAIDGMGGMGKSQLAYELAFRLADRFPDGRIFLDLQGTGERPLAPEDAMARVIEAFSPDARPPGEPDRLKAAYQQTLAGKRALLLLDNAADTRQVAPLLPPAPVALLVTSRQRILLQGAKSLELRTLTPENALLLLRGMVPEPRADDAALATIARHCGRLPLALRAAGSFLQAHPSWTVEDYLNALAGERTRLAALAVPEAQLDVRSVLGLGLAKLREETPELAAAWTLSAVFPAGFDREAAAAVWQQDLALTRDRLDALVNRSLLTAEQEARFRLHDLLRDLAREQAEAMALQAAHLRHGEHYVSVLGRAHELYLAGAPLDGLALFDSERANIEAAQAWAAAHLEQSREAAQLCFDLSNAGAYVLDLRLPPRVRVRWLEAAREGCRVTGNRRGEGQALGNLGNAWAALGETRKAIELYEQHLAIAREIGDRRGEGDALGNLGNAWAALGETRKAIELYEQTAIAREIGDRRGRALGNLGLAWAALGETRKAIEHEQLASPARSATDAGQSRLAWAALGETRKAIELYEQDLAIAREIGDRRGEGARAGQSRHRLGRPRRDPQGHRALRAAARDRPRDRRPSGRGRRAGQSRHRLGRPRRDPQGHRALRAASRDRPRDRRPSGRGQRALEPGAGVREGGRPGGGGEAGDAVAFHPPRDRGPVRAQGSRLGCGNAASSPERSAFALFA